MGAEFLLEIGTEEIPAGMIRDALDHLADAVAQALARHDLAGGEAWRSATPRRLVVRIDNVPERQADRDEEVVGPPASAGVDAAGAWTRAALGFAAKQGVDAAALTVAETPKGRYVAARKRIAGRAAADVLAEALPGIVRGIPFPKTMYWREDKFRFVRPIRSLLALFGGAVVPFEVAGVAAGDRTFGHRFLGAAAFPVTDFADYERRLAEHGVILDAGRRREKIQAEIARIEAETGLRAAADPGLLEQVVYLNELPTVIPGAFEERFLAIPAEVLVTVMRHHQKYFSLNTPDGSLAPRFLAVINMDADREGLIRAGHERVLKARLVDAEFFWNNDRKLKLAERAPALEGILFQEALGSYGAKTRRVEALAVWLAEHLGESAATRDAVAEAAALCKVDLATEMVKELTELQGVMGGLYARKEGCPPEVWQAIYEHHRPEGMDDPIPASLSGAILSIADKADTVAGMLGLGFVPTGSKDPFGLRRQATGIYRILLEKDLDADLAEVFLRATAGLGELATAPADESAAVLQELLEGRLRFLYQQAGYRYDEINAVIAAAVRRPADGRRRLEALTAIRTVAAFASIFTAGKRIRNILDKQAAPPEGGPDAALFAEEAERRLGAVLADLGPRVRADITDCRYAEALAIIEQFARPVDAFFDQVLVMHEDAAIRTNRLRLLRAVGELFDSYCDFSRFVLEETKSVNPITV